jgi:Na+/melibiose symporter-like transporter
LLAAVFLMKNVTAQREAKVHVPSIILSSLGWGGLLYGFSMVGTDGWTDPAVMGTLFIGFLSLVMFIRLQLRMERPLLEFQVFRSRMFTLTTVLSVILFALMIGSQTFLPLYTQHVRGLSALESGLMLLPGAIVNGIMSPITGRIFDRIGGRGLAIVGFSLIVLSMLLFLNIGMSTSILYIALVFVLMMLGISMNMMPLMTAGMNSLPPHLIPHGTAMSNTLRMVGGSIGTALLVSVMSSVSESHGASDPSSALLDGILAGFAVSGVLAVLGLLITFSMARKKEQKQAAVQK